MATAVRDDVAEFDGDESIDHPEMRAPEVPAAAFSLAIQYVERALIHPDPAQPRQEPDAELRDSIARNGLLQPITVRPHPHDVDMFMIVDGERRWKGSEGVLAVLPVVVRHDQENDVARLRTQLVANTGKPLTPIEEARAYAQLLQATGGTVSDLADEIGRPRSSVAERVQLLELGPWLALVESGEVPLSHAVRVLLPIRVVPDKHHEKAIESVKKDYRWGKRGAGTGAAGMSIGDFEQLVNLYYRSFMYPLAKTKGYGKQPEFNTKAHDSECGCGVVKFDLGNGTARACCANPDWWRPRHRKALAEKKAKTPASKQQGRGGVTLDLPNGAPTVKSGYGDAPKGVIVLTAEQGRWRPANAHHNAELGFDPADLIIDDAKLVRVVPSYGDDQVGTKDVAAVKAARAKWTERWSRRRVALDEALLAAYVEHGETFRVHGADGALQLVKLIAAHHADDTVDLARMLGIEVPDAVLKSETWQRGGKVAAWVAKMNGDDAERLASAFATVAGRALKLPSEQLEHEMRAALEKICQKPSPWVATKKKGKAAKAKRAGSGKPAPKAADVDDQDDDAGWSPDEDDDSEDLVDGITDDEDVDDDA